MDAISGVAPAINQLNNSLKGPQNVAQVKKPDAPREDAPQGPAVKPEDLKVSGSLDVEA